MVGQVLSIWGLQKKTAPSEWLPLAFLDPPFFVVRIHWSPRGLCLPFSQNHLDSRRFRAGTSPSLQLFSFRLLASWIRAGARIQWRLLELLGVVTEGTLVSDYWVLMTVREYTVKLFVCLFVCNFWCFSSSWQSAKTQNLQKKGRDFIVFLALIRLESISSKTRKLSPWNPRMFYFLSQPSWIVLGAWCCSASPL